MTIVSNQLLRQSSQSIEAFIARDLSDTIAVDSTLAVIVDLTQRRALTLIRFRKTTRYLPEDELPSEVSVKLIKSIERFNPERGTAFTYVSRVVANVLCTGKY